MSRPHVSGGTETRRRARGKQPLGWIYMIREDSPEGFIKIGYCATEQAIQQRVAALQTGNPRRLRPYALARGTMEAERQLHARFAADRACGEWFLPSQELHDLALQWLIVEVAA